MSASSEAPARPDAPAPSSGVDRFFRITERGSTVSTEIRGGFVTFFTMAYIVVLNPLIIGTVPDADGKFLGGGDVPDLALVAAGTALVAGVVTILMGVVANFPLALATGLGLNAFVAFSIASEMSWADAMGLVVIEGLIILVLVLTGFRTAVFHAVPPGLKVAISVGIGGGADDERVEHDDVGHREEGREAAADLALHGRPALGDAEVAVEAVDRGPARGVGAHAHARSVPDACCRYVTGLACRP